MFCKNNPNLLKLSIKLQNFTKILINQYLVLTKCCIKMYFYSFEMNNIYRNLTLKGLILDKINFNFHHLVAAVLINSVTNSNISG